MSNKCTPLWRRSTCRSQHVQNTPHSDQFWKLKCSKSVRQCGGKHISKSEETGGFGRLLDVQMSFCTLPRVSKTWGFVAGWTTTTTTLYYTILHYTTLHYTTLHYTPLQLQLPLPLHYTTLHYTALHCLHYTSLHSIILRYNYNCRYNTLHYTTLITWHYATLIALHNTNYIHYTTLHYTTLHYTTLRSTTLHNHNDKRQLRYITLHYATLH